MSTVKMRKEFEAFVAGYPSLAQYGFEKYPAGSDEYDAIALQDAWESWQASREAIEIKLPRPSSFGRDEDTISAWEARVVVDACASAGVSINRSGYMVRPEIQKP